ncbi:hypothetical protein N802_07345 [Knoellia sinensis KCTC 19936]|uniref:Uncharacterized protein n=1 Tax=Knoellia sinensis KCTC 19936 TaxID=1385520 RepID=A0A0A0JD36_9MICO|nr:hypothetical protein [Knoellia sinensis]KGN33942.1 hypothetical protein N802_07345 [Knoellia sinensis KCTC 19936]
MSFDMEDLLRNELRGAASSAPHDLGIADQDVLTRGRRVVVRRRVLTVAGAAAATLVIAGTIGVLAPRAGDTDTLPAVPTPTVTPTPDVTPTTTSSASPSATVTSSATATPNSTPSATTTTTTTPESTPSRTPSKSPSPSTTSASVDWTDPVSVGGVAYSARLVRDGMSGDYPNYKAELRANGSLVYTRHDPNGEHGLGIAADPRVVYASHVGPLSDVVSENGQPVSGEEFRSITLPFPDTGHEYPKGSMTFTIIKLPRPATVDENGNVTRMVVRNANGTEASLGVGYDF